jgi:hypothetical protein
VIAEASAPCRVEVAGGAATGATVGVAIDRRAWCRVETGIEGIEVESKDALRRARGRDVSEIPGSGPLGLVARVLRALAVDGGVRVVTQSRVPEGAGLGEWGALAVAVAAATARALGRDLGGEELAGIARIAAAPAIADGDIAVRGGTVTWSADGGAPRPEALAVDPGRIEESLLLIQCERPLTPIDDAEVPAVVSVAGRIQVALARGRLEDVTGLWREEWEVRGAGAPDAARRIAGIVQEAGGAVRASGGRGGSVLAAWAPPGERGPGRREAVREAAREAGLRLFASRIDLRGLEVD